MYAPVVARMHRTQIYLPDDLTRALDALARERGTSRGGLLREAAQQLVEDERTTPSFGADPLDAIVGMAGPGGPPDLSERHDDYLVESERRRWSS